MNNKIIGDGFIGEKYADDVALVFKPKNILVSKKTKYQQVDIVDTESYGRILFLDNLLMKTDKDGHIVSEMITHVPMRTGKEKKKVLVIGGGEGFTATLLLNYPELEQIDVVDIDNEFVDITRKIYPDMTKSFDNPKVNLHLMDGLEFIKNSEDSYDVIFVTATDPSGLSNPLFSEEFYEHCFTRLSDDGLFMTDAYMPFYNFGEVDFTYMYKKVNKYYETTKLYQCTVPSFPGGLFAFVIGSKNYDPEADLRKDAPKIETKYYNEKIHKASFKLPQFMLDKLLE